MKTETIIEKCQEIYPALYRADKDGEVVLMTSKREGFTVDPGSSGNCIGYKSTSWNMSYFKLLEGKVILEN